MLTAQQYKKLEGGTTFAPPVGDVDANPVTAYGINNVSTPNLRAACQLEGMEAWQVPVRESAGTPSLFAPPRTATGLEADAAMADVIARNREALRELAKW